MTPRRILGASIAILLSGGAHLIGSGWFAPDQIELDGGGDPLPARLGTSFADIVAGMPGTERPDVTEPAATVTAAETAAEIETEVITQSGTTAAAPIEVMAETPEPSATEAARSITAADPSEAQTAASTEATAAALSASAITATPSVVGAVAAGPPTAPPLTPAVTAEIAHASPTEAISGTETDALTPLSSPRPTRRPDGLAPLPQPASQPQVTEQRPPEPQQPAATGNGAANSTRGNTSGTETGTATATAPAAQPVPQAGNAAAVANYPGQVMRQISRQGRPRLRHSGPDAVVAFRISSNGGLAGLSIARSSGNPELDQAGLSIIQRATPFPPPPNGAQTSFSVAFGGR